MNTKQSLTELIEGAKLLGLPNIDVENSKEMLKYNEYELCIDILITQLYEYNIKINYQFYNLFQDILKKIKVDSEKYSFIKELIKIT